MSDEIDVAANELLSSDLFKDGASSVEGSEEWPPLPPADRQRLTEIVGPAVALAIEKVYRHLHHLETFSSERNARAAPLYRRIAAAVDELTAAVQAFEEFSPRCGPRREFGGLPNRLQHDCNNLFMAEYGSLRRRYPFPEPIPATVRQPHPLKDRMSVAEIDAWLQGLEKIRLMLHGTGYAAGGGRPGRRPNTLGCMLALWVADVLESGGHTVTSYENGTLAQVMEILAPPRAGDDLQRQNPLRLVRLAVRKRAWRKGT